MTLQTFVGLTFDLYHFFFPLRSKVGDGTTSVVLLAGEILRICKPFVEENVHPQVIVRGLRKAAQLALAKISEIAVHVKHDDPV